MTLILGSFWGIVGGLLAWKLKVPGGAAIGAMIGCGVYSFFKTTSFTTPTWFSISAQIAVGIVVGFSVNKSLLSGGLTVLVWALIGAFVYLLVALLLTWISTSLGFLEFDEAMFGFSPGGFTNMSIIAEAEGAEAVKVSLIHFTRVFLLFIIVPLLFRIIKRFQVGD